MTPEPPRLPRADPMTMKNKATSKTYRPTLASVAEAVRWRRAAFAALAVSACAALPAPAASEALGALACPKGTEAQRSASPCDADGDCEGASETAWCAMPDGLRHGPQRSWFDHGGRKSPRSSGAFVKGKKQGPWTWWYRNGNKRSFGAFEADLRTGPWTIWHDNGRKESQGRFKADTPDGRWTAWDPEGRMESQGAYAEGVRVGAWSFWREGRLEARGIYVAGQRHGPWIATDLAGLTSTRCYDHGNACEGELK